MDLDDMMLELRAGRMDALAEIYAQTKAPVYAVVYAVLRHKQAAEDVMQDVYVHLVRMIGKYRPAGKPQAWICKMAKNLARNYARDNRRTVPLDEDAAGAPFAEDGCRDIIDAAAEVLTPKETELVLLHALGGFSHAELAKYQRIPYATARWRYHNALEKLRSRLEKEDYLS